MNNAPNSVLQTVLFFIINLFIFSYVIIHQLLLYVVGFYFFFLIDLTHEWVWFYKKSDAITISLAANKKICTIFGSNGNRKYRRAFQLKSRAAFNKCQNLHTEIFLFRYLRPFLFQNESSRSFRAYLHRYI